MRQKTNFKIIPTLLLLLISVFFYSNTITSQEKGIFLKNRFKNDIEVITKKTTIEDLSRIKYNLNTHGVHFNYSKLKRNSKKEIIQLFIRIKNKKSNFSSLWKDKNNPIPNIKIGEFNGIVYALSEHITLQID